MRLSLGIHLRKAATTLLLAGGLFLCATSKLQAARSASVASGKNGVVVAGEKRAAEIGTQVLEKGGNAADATTAALLALSVTKIGAFTIGGEASVILYDAHQRKAHALWAQGAAPLDPQAIAWYLKNGMPASDIRTAAVPAAVDLCVTLLKQYGTISFEEAVKPTLALLDAGGPTWYIDTSDGSKIETARNWQADLARTLRKLVEAEQKTMRETARSGCKRWLTAFIAAISRTSWKSGTYRREDFCENGIWRPTGPISKIRFPWITADIKY